MKNEMMQLLGELLSENDDLRNNSFLNISLLVESTLIPALTQENEQLLEIHGFEKIRLTESEARFILAKMFEYLSDDAVPIEIRAGIVSLLSKFNDISYLEASMKFLQQRYPDLDNQQVYSILASINPQNFPSKNLGQITKLIQEVNLTEILVELRTRNNDKVNDALFHIWGKFKQIGFEPKNYPREYMELLLWYIKSNYNLLNCEELNSLIESMPYKDVAHKDPSLLKTLVERYSFRSILNEIDVRSFEEYHSHLAQECPEELAGILECYDKDEYEKDHKILKETILEITKCL